jgi:hypothetical protein
MREVSLGVLGTGLAISVYWKGHSTLFGDHPSSRDFPTVVAMDSRVRGIYAVQRAGVRLHKLLTLEDAL